MWEAVGMFIEAGLRVLTIFLRVGMGRWFFCDFDRGWGYIFVESDDFCLVNKVLNAKRLLF